VNWLLASGGLLLAASAICALLRRQPRAALRLGMGAAVGACAMALVPALQVLLSDAQPAMESVELPLGHFRLKLDLLGAWFVLTICITSAAAAVHSLGYVDPQRDATWSYASVFCLLLCSLLGLVCSSDAVLFLVFWETMLLGAFFLVGFHDRDPETRRAAWVYLVANHIGTAFFVLPMFAVLWLKSGSTRFEDFSGFAATPVVFLLALLGFGTKAGLIPLHIWLPIAHPLAPAPVSAILSGVMVKMGVYGLVRVISWSPQLPRWCAVTLIVAGAFSGLLGVLYAVAQHDLKRLLAFHTVENVGIIILGLGVGLLGRSLGQPVLECAGFAGALLHVLNHSLFKGLLFLSAGALIHSTGTTMIDRLGGLSRAGRLHSSLFLIGALAICGLPPFNGFVSEWLIYGSLAGCAVRGTAVASALSIVGFVALAAMGGLAIACFAKAFGAIFLGVPRDPAVRPHRVPAMMLAPMALLALLCVVIGLAAGPAAALAVKVSRGMGVSAGVSLRDLLPPSQLMLTGGLFLGAVVLLGALRALLGRAPAGRVDTWGCGYSRPTARMQYTATSFAWSLVSSNREILLTERHVEPPLGVLPAAAGRVHSHTPDASFDGLFAPLFAALRRLFRMMQTLTWSGEPAVAHAHIEVGHRASLRRLLGAVRRRGIHISITYIILVLVALFVIEAVRHSGARTEPPPAGGARP